MPAKEQEESQTSVKKETVLVEWTAAARPFKRRSREFYVTLISISLLVGIILFLVEGFMPVILLISLLFLFYVMSTIEPDQMKYVITDQGIQIGNNTIDWLNMGRFWFSNRMGARVLVVEIDRIPGRLELVIDPSMEEKIAKKLSEYLLHEEVSPSGLDKMAQWFSKKLPE